MNGHADKAKQAWGEVLITLPPPLPRNLARVYRGLGPRALGASMVARIQSQARPRSYI